MTRKSICEFWRQMQFLKNIFDPQLVESMDSGLASTEGQLYLFFFPASTLELLLAHPLVPF